MPNMNLREYIIARISKMDFSKIFIVDSMNNCEYTYTHVFSLAYYLSKSLMEKTNIVIMENGIELLLAYFATVFGNTVIIPVDPKKRDTEIKLIKKNHKDAKIIMEVLMPIEIQTLNKKQIIDIFEQIDYDKGYLITYTSGSAGEPKGVLHSFGNLLHSAINFGERLNYSENTNLCHVMPMTYMAGILNTIFLPFIMGGKIVLMPRFTAQNAVFFWKTVMKYNINTFWLSPTMLHMIMMMDKGDRVVSYFENTNITISVGTAPLPVSLKKKFESKYKMKIYQSYGLSETLFITTADETLKNMDSVGRTIDEVVIAFTEEGEILLDIPWMFMGYVNADTEDYFVDKKYKTGDLGKFADDELIITGRKKDLIIKGGMNIYPIDIENCLNDIDGVKECCVGAVNINNEEKIACWYSGYEEDEKDLNNLVTEKLGNHYRIDYFIKMDSLYKNLNGKIDKKRLLEEFQQNNDYKSGSYIVFGKSSG